MNPLLYKEIFQIFILVLKWIQTLSRNEQSIFMNKWTKWTNEQSRIDKVSFSTESDSNVGKGVNCLSFM